MTAQIDMLTLSRNATTRIVRAAIEATAEAEEMETCQRMWHFRQANPQALRDFAVCDQFKALTKLYLAGQLNGTFLAAAITLLRKLMPEIGFDLEQSPPPPDAEAEALAGDMGRPDLAR